MKTLSGKAFCKLLEKHGWILKRKTKGSHFIYTRSNDPATISVPVHGNKDPREVCKPT